MRIRTVDISDEAAEVLRRGLWNGRVFMLPAGKIERDLYVKIDKALRALGGKWNKGVRGHVFEQDAASALMQALNEGSIVDQKRTLEQFFTPADLAARMVDALDIREGTHVLEPSAGNGRLIWEALERGALVTAVELDADHCAGLIHETRERQKHGDLFVFNADFIEWTPASPHPIDVVIMNPPFSGNQDIRHVQQALRWLRPGGKLAAIMSPHFTFARDAASEDFRELIGYPSPPRSAQLGMDPPAERIAEASVQLLPAGTFKASGTNVSAVLVLIEKAA